MQAKIIERQKQIELQEQENLRVQRKLEATIKKQAEAKELLAFIIFVETISIKSPDNICYLFSISWRIGLNHFKGQKDI